MSQDSQLQQKIIAELEWEPSVNSAHIGVMTNDGVVTLTGHVETFAEKYAAETAATRVKGVKAIAEEIEVQLPSIMNRGDDEVAAAALHCLAWNTFVPADALHLKVDKGWITIGGQVEWSYQKQAVEQELRQLVGVVGISNHITVKPTANAKDISDDIQDALARSWFYDPNSIKVSAKGGDITLTGSVHSWQGRELAGSTAWSASGATHVENDITVN
jgi:osmotically-inducible protein OsmY